MLPCTPSRSKGGNGNPSAPKFGNVVKGRRGVVGPDRSEDEVEKIDPNGCQCKWKSHRDVVRGLSIVQNVPVNVFSYTGKRH